MKKLKIKDIELQKAKHLVMSISKSFQEQGKTIHDSNIFHFVAFEVNKKCELGLTCGWFKHGPYVLGIDDALIELGIMKPDQHQLYGKEELVEPMISSQSKKRVDHEN